MKTLKRTLLSTLIIASVAGLTACGGGGSGDSKPAGPSGPDEEFSATLPSNKDLSSNTEGQAGLISVDMDKVAGELKLGSGSSSISTQKAYEQCKSLADGLNQSFNKTVYEGISQITLGGREDAQNVVTKAGLKVDGAGKTTATCVLQLGAGVVIKNLKPSENNFDDIPERDIIFTKYSDGSVKLSNGKLSLLGSTQYDNDKHTLTFKRTSNPKFVIFNSATDNGNQDGVPTFKDLKPNKGALSIFNGINVVDERAWSTQAFNTNYGEGMYYGENTADLSIVSSSLVVAADDTKSNYVTVYFDWLNHEYPVSYSYFDLVLKVTSDELGENATEAYFKFTPNDGKGEVVIYTMPQRIPS